MSDQSLRDALERVLATTDGWAVSNETLLDLLRAHPAEPAGVSDEAVGLYPLDNELVREFNRHAWPEGSVSDALSMALEAAQPFMQPQVVIDHRPGETCSVVAEVDPETGFARAPAGDGGLRDVLEKLAAYCADEARQPNPDCALSYADVRDKLQALLAAHPVEPAPDDEWPAWIDPEDGFNYSSGVQTDLVRDSSWRPEGCICLSRFCPIHGDAK